MHSRQLLSLAVLVTMFLAPRGAEGADYGARYTPGPIPTLATGQPITISVTVTNTGDLAWSPDDFMLSYHWYPEGTVPPGTAPPRFGDPFYEGRRTRLPKPVAPRESATLRVQLQAPATPRTYILKWDMVREGVTWFSQAVPPVATGDQTVRVLRRSSGGIGRQGAWLVPDAKPNQPVRD